MQREIKFRVWDGKKFLYTDLSKRLMNDSGGHPYLRFNLSNYFDKEMDFVIQQYIGIKDKNGNPIYEGDIIKFMGRWNEKGEVLTPNYEPYEVIWFNGGLYAWRMDMQKKALSIHKHNDLLGVGHTDNEVIGNIFENKEYQHE